MLDTRYTGKAAYRMLHDLNTHPEKFKGKEILFIHTGIQILQGFIFKLVCEVFKLKK